MIVFPVGYSSYGSLAYVDQLMQQEHVLLIDTRYDMRIDRVQCMAIIEKAGLPVPPKSSCYFCPFHRVAVWQEMRQSQPELFQKACDLEEYINKKRAQIGKDQVWLSRGLKPLMQVTTELHQASLFDEDDEVCESGYCFA